VQPFVDVYLGVVTGTELPPGGHLPGANPLDEMLG
jgi:hypothetical protein